MITLVLLLGATMFVAMPVKAGVKFGVKGGLNASSLSFNTDVFKASNRVGFFIGPTVNATIPLLGFGVDGSVLYDQKNAKVDDKSIKHQEIVIPINLRYNVGLGSIASMYFAAGPQFGFNVGGSEFSWTSVDSYKNTFQLKKSNLSVNVGVGVTLIKHIEAGVAYNIGLGKTGDGIIDQAKGAFNSHTNAWRISVGYYF